MTTIRLYGHLGKRFGKRFQLDVGSPAEAVRALCLMIPGFQDYFKDYSYKVLVGDEPQTAETITAPVGGQCIKFIPVVEGGKDDILSIIGGVVLIIAGVWVSGLSWGLASPVGGAMIGMGVSMILGGIAQMMADSPYVGGPDDPANNGNFFDGPENAATQGCSVPVGYGEMLVGSVLVGAYTSPEAYHTGERGGPFGGNVGTWTRMQNGGWDGTTQAWTNNGNGDSSPWCFNVDPQS